MIVYLYFNDLCNEQQIEPAARLFEHPVDTTIFSDYLQFVKSPMALSTVEKNIESGLYLYAEGTYAIFVTSDCIGLQYITKLT